MNRVALLLRKDLLVLRRSPLLLGILIAYPLAIALLVGLVASYASSKPRVALVDEDNLPATRRRRRQALRRRPHDSTRRARTSKLVRLSPDEADAAAATNGKVVAVVTVPPGFIATLKGMVRSPQLELAASRGTISLAGRAAGAGARLLAQPPAPARVHRERTSAT